MADKAKKPSFTTSKTLRICSAILHSALIVVFVILLVTWAKGLEHRFTVPLKHEKLVSSLITATTTAFGTIYSAVLVFVSQSLSMRRSLQVDQSLTATHDTTAAWAGLGASLLYLWRQNTTPSRASRIGVLPVTLYLATILALDITASSLFSLVAFNTTQIYVATTQSLPAYNGSSNASAFGEMEIYADGSLYFLPSVLESTTISLGLQEGTLYDVLDTTSAAAGNATVKATGFEVTCGYVVDTPDFSVPTGGGARRNIAQFHSSANYWTDDNSTYKIFLTGNTDPLGRYLHFSP
ncbi:hypothetical protein B0H16DRAFT_169916 [Mycena metata]|uniref:Uncharacterized protein n=1 Tax=Mycena metata TaxID=1033252 RepID=A0AAD7JVG2_9AGAR|nr:hypothetical protein B0H16DRAFT_169916 [Mycena metata]